MKSIFRTILEIRRKLGQEKMESVPCFTMRPILHEEHTPDFFNKSLSELQDILIDKGYLDVKTDCFDAKTKEAVKSFQSSKSLVADGIVGPLTWAALLFPTLYMANQDNLEDAKKHVAKLQSLLNKEGYKIRVDGRFSHQTKRALKKFQIAHALLADGVCGPRTWSILLGQRQVLSPSLSRDIRDFLEREWLMIDQLFMVASIQFGILFNPFEDGHRYPFWTTLAVSYVLAYIGPLILEKKISLLLDQLEGKNFQVLRFAPYVLIGFLSRQILHTIRLVLIP
ncbi:peptidoglycan-binding protein [Nodosilinea sp. LEGE 07088]|uniref:peptidoglycan-binding domain-containing protein n=1 Tax=Nodosilinea sp. LEGE 07088 TaxID=2777968 RepID=UPI0018803FCC|nr:peptidoglycan-binding protein [Nodosilinea sp. LEGE 07088]MBE9139156.1 peptidoglycan-binding protein [Nodosilinea sp. LEGE 07088]